MKKIISTTFDMLTYVADHPERQLIVHILKEGRYRLQWDYVSRIEKTSSALFQMLQANDDQILDKTGISLSQYRICCNWDISAKGNRATKNDKQPPNYPKTMLNNQIHPEGRYCIEK